VAYGLDADVALRALTINPAEIFGVADRYGSLEPGKVANVVVTTGDPMDVRSVVRHLFIRGTPVPLDDRHTRLYEQFRARPKP
jgi:imidazolonepropionase-like amidohydrolase